MIRSKISMQKRSRFSDPVFGVKRSLAIRDFSDRHEIIRKINDTIIVFPNPINIHSGIISAPGKG
jgi:hypothetical protein